VEHGCSIYFVTHEWHILESSAIAILMVLQIRQTHFRRHAEVPARQGADLNYDFDQTET
jgi:hypothetical protein